MKKNNLRAAAIRTIILGGATLGASFDALGDEPSISPPIVSPRLVSPETVEPPIVAPQILAPVSKDPLASDLPVTSEPIFDVESIARAEGVSADAIITKDVTDGTPGIARGTISRGAMAAPNDGEAEVIRERYNNGAVKVERTVRQDTAGNYVNHGSFYYFTSSGDVIAQGQFVMGDRDGSWKRVFTRGEAKLFSAYPYSEFEGPFVSQADFAGGQLNGQWVITDSRGQVISEIPFVGGLRHGKAVWNHPNGKLMYSATYQSGMLEGAMAEFDEAGNELSNYKFTNGRRTENEVEHHKNQQVKAETQYLSAQQVLKTKDDWWEAVPAVYETSGKRVKHGPFVEYWPNGQKKAQGQFDEGRLSGQYASWYENGQRESRGEYVAGNATGPWTWWHDNGMRRAEGSYDSGTPDGSWTSWDPTGKVARRQRYSESKGTMQTKAPTRNHPVSASRYFQMRR